MVTRRRTVTTGLALIAGGYLGAIAPRARAQSLEDALAASDLIYLTPLKGDGSESSCQAEIWFARHEADLYVVTSSDAWRAQAVGLGLTRTRVWVGDVGVWSDSGGSYRSLPQIEAVASTVAEVDVQEAVLDIMGDKYRMSWLVWGPRFRNGLADGSRVMLRYRPATA
ncbi:MAG: hypothetical protein GWM88_01990 [Pseudomonadales bacterium]|nr:hypothetical protein [Pseudomonadales bacterium]NIX06850.1 hypothetical protein [Pseudomonadales bacterium]